MPDVAAGLHGAAGLRGTAWRWWRCVAVTALTLAGLAAAAPAVAHGDLIATQPADGALVTTAPALVRLTFDDPVRDLGPQVRVLSPTGRVVSAGPPRLVGPDVYQDLEGLLPAGRYEVRWRVAAADGHPLSGRFAFTTRDPNVVTASGAAPAAITPVPAAAPTERGAAWWWLVAPVLVLATAVILLTRRRSARR